MRPASHRPQRSRGRSLDADALAYPAKPSRAAAPRNLSPDFRRTHVGHMTILIVDDHAETRVLLERALHQSDDAWNVAQAATATEALAYIAANHVECVLLDYRLPDLDGLTCLREIRRRRADVPVIMITGAGSEDVAVEAMKAGAADYVRKHATYVHAIPGMVRQTLGRRALDRLTAGGADGQPSRELRGLDAAARARFAADGFVFRSPAMAQVLALVEHAARSNVAVLIEGESGTGKELVARAIHGHGPRAARRFVAQNCAAVPETLLDSELFGHVRGAFTGADRTRAGLFEQADGGTLFLDEIGEAIPPVQARLLRALQEREVRPVGATEARRVDVRVITATNRDLRHETDSGRFRLDLLYRLRVFPIVMPPLRQRREDVAPLARHFLERFAREEAKSIAGFHPDTLAAMERYTWPGNVRQLQNEIQRLVLCAETEEEIAPDALLPWVAGEIIATAATEAPLHELMRQIETAIVQARLRTHGYRRGDTARSLGITRESLWAKLRALGLVRSGST